MGYITIEWNKRKLNEYVQDRLILFNTFAQIIFFNLNKINLKILCRKIRNLTQIVFVLQCKTCYTYNQYQVL